MFVRKSLRPTLFCSRLRFVNTVPNLWALGSTHLVTESRLNSPTLSRIPKDFCEGTHLSSVKSRGNRRRLSKTVIASTWPKIRSSQKWEDSRRPISQGSTEHDDVRDPPFSIQSKDSPKAISPRMSNETISYHLTIFSPFGLLPSFPSLPMKLLMHRWSTNSCSFRALAENACEKRLRFVPALFGSLSLARQASLYPEPNIS